MRYAIGLALLAGVLTTARGDDKGKVDEKLVGSWALTKLKPMEKTDPAVEGVLFTFTAAGKFTISKKDSKEGATGTFTTDTTKTPKAIDLTFPDEPDEKERTVKAIYKVEGDTLTLVRSNSARDRPTSLDGDKVTTTLILKRQKP